VASLALLQVDFITEGAPISTREKLIKARLSMLVLAEQLKNVSLACHRASTITAAPMLDCPASNSGGMD